MRPVRVAALLLIVGGALTLAYPALSYTTHEKVLDVGAIQVTREEHHAVPLPRILGGAAVVIGIGLLVGGRRRSA
jgi:hypothetical protein